jgi:hypothetical protein
MKLLKLVAILGIAILISLPSLAFAKRKPPNDDPPVEPTVEYKVELTTGVFTFPEQRVTLNSRGYLKSLYPDQFVIGLPTTNENGEQDTWGTVIHQCAGELANDDGTDGAMHVMLVDFDEWAVGRNGDDGILWINLKSIRLPSAEFPEKEIQIILRLINDPVTTATYPPTAGNSVQTFELDSYVIWGKPLGGKGKKGWDTCYHSDLESDVNFPPAELVIEYIGVVN